MAGNQTATPTSPLSIVPAQIRSDLIRRILSEGGFAFVASLESVAASCDLREAEAAREMAWEQLHSGPWSEVGSAWRDAYAMSCLYVAWIREGLGELEEAMKVLDLGIIMGGALLRKDLDASIDRIAKAKRRLLMLEEKMVAAVESDGDKFDLQEVLQVLPSRSLSCNIVEKRTCVSLETFICDYFLRSSPVIISGCIDHWPARTKWKDIEYLKRIAGDRTVPVEVGKNYLSSEWKQELITFSQFLERVKTTDCPANLTYLAQHPLFDQIQELHDDIVIPDYCFAGGGKLQSLNAWFGPPGTVVGRKYIRLYPASVSEDLYPYSETMLSNSSQVDLDDLNDNEFPRATELEFMDCILEEGEMIYIPPKWWHYVRSLSLSFSVSFWWSATSGLPHGGKQ